MRSMHAEAGLSSVEVIVMAAIMSVLMIMITESMTTLSGVRADQRVQMRVGDVGDDVARRLAKDIDHASRIFTDTPVDIEYLQAMDLGLDPFASGRKLPKLTTNGFFEPDKSGTPETGNVLFLACRIPRVAVKYETIAEYHVQCLVFTVGAPIDVAGNLDLLRWSSDLVVDYWDIADITDPTARADVLVQLYDNGVRFAWDSTSPRASGLFEITAAGGMALLPTDRNVTGAEDVHQSRPFSRRRLRLAANGVEGPHPVPRYAVQSGAFPGGFELKIDGAASGKLVLLRMVTQSKQKLTQPVTGEILRFFSTQG